MADTIGYAHKKIGVRITGLVYSGVIFFIELGVAIGGALAGWLLTFYGYQANIEQGDSTKQVSILSFTILPALGSFAVAWVIRKYTLTDQKVTEIQTKLSTTSS